jgi:hypothetical protein
MSQSRTALDDNEYVNRFNRLNGAINNLSFNIRKDWRRLPQWLEKFVSPDALKTGKQEMTAVGRAVITRWIVDEIFNKCFHPDLDASSSAQLKEIELSIRGNAYTMHSQEEFDALTTKVVNWRMATLDGLQHKLSSTASEDNRASLIAKTQTNLTAHLYQFLIEPPPAGVDGSTSMIVELAIGIAANMPRESRDVTIMYPLPGDVLQAGVMEVEKTGLPSLDGSKEGEASKPDSDADKDKSSSSGDSSKTGRLHSAAPPGLKRNVIINAFANFSITNRVLQRYQPSAICRICGSRSKRAAGLDEGTCVGVVVRRKDGDWLFVFFSHTTEAGIEWISILLCSSYFFFLL